MIVKVQICLRSTEAQRMVLVYTEERAWETELPLAACPGLHEAMLDTAPQWRAFFEAEIVGGKLSIGRRLPEQGW